MKTVSYFSKALTLPSNHPMNELSKSTHMHKLQWPETKKKPGIIRSEEIKIDYDFPSLETIETPVINPNPPWDDQIPEVHLLMDNENRSLPESILKSIFTELEETKYRNHLHIYTDGSKTEVPKVGCAIHIPLLTLSIMCRLDDHVPIVVAELHAIKIAMFWIMHNLHQINSSQIVIFSDSQSGLRATKSKGTTTPL